VHAVTEGTDAQAEVSVRLDDEAAGKSVTARAADPDTLVASAKAYIAALNKLEVKRLRSRPEPVTALPRAEMRGP
jgi:2-isopropylmalate synthase